MNEIIIIIAKKVIGKAIDITKTADPIINLINVVKDQCVIN